MFQIVCNFFIENVLAVFVSYFMFLALEYEFLYPKDQFASTRNSGSPFWARQYNFHFFFPKRSRKPCISGRSSWFGEGTSGLVGTPGFVVGISGFGESKSDVGEGTSDSWAHVGPGTCGPRPIWASWTFCTAWTFCTLRHI